MKNKITVGSDVYTDAEIFHAKTHTSNSVSFETLEYDTATFAVISVEHKPAVYKYGTSVYINHEGIDLGRYYIQKVRRTGRDQYKIDCVSAIGLLASIRHYGGVYEDVSVADVIRDIIGKSIPYEVAPAAAKLRVYGWLPIDTKRNNLHQLMIAYGLGITGYTASWAPIFGYIDTERSTPIPAQRIYMGGSVGYDDGVDSVAVTEHTYTTRIRGDEVVLFEGTVEPTPVITPSGKETLGRLITFEEPMITPLTITGGASIIEQHPNYAVISPANNCRLTGNKVFHTTRQIVKSYNTAQEFLTENSEVIEEATLISFLNSEAVTDRVYEYYSKAKTVSMSIIPDGNFAGQTVEFTDPFNDPTRGIIASMDTTLSTILKSDAKVITNYTPYDVDKVYKNVDIVTTNQTYTVKPGVEKIRVIIIGGGDGGASGCAGGEPSYMLVDKTPYWPQGKCDTAAYAKINEVEPGAGGKAGEGGKGGKIAIITLAVTPGQQFAVSVGAGGVGGIAAPGATDSVPGQPGSDTMFGPYTSGDGVSAADGIVPNLTSVVLGKTGKVGITGGPGSYWAWRYNENSDYPPKPNYRRFGVTMPDGTRYHPGVTPELNQVDSVEFIAACDSIGKRYTGSYSGCGGGAAAGANGKDGLSDHVRAQISPQGLTFSWQSAGGDGADAAINGFAGAEIGEGGGGGHGGGGGGSNGMSYGWYYGIPRNLKTFNVYDNTSGPSKGGNGSNGGTGADGGVLIYY